MSEEKRFKRKLTITSEAGDFVRGDAGESSALCDAFLIILGKEKAEGDWAVRGVTRDQLEDPTVPPAFLWKSFIVLADILSDAVELPVWQRLVAQAVQGLARDTLVAAYNEQAERFIKEVAQQIDAAFERGQAAKKAAESEEKPH